MLRRAIVLFVALSTNPAFAKVTVTPLNFSAKAGTALESGPLYVGAIYTSTVTSVAGGFIDPALTLIDLAIGSVDEANGSRNNMLVVDVTTDQDVPVSPGQTLALVIEAKGSTVTTVPIAAVGLTETNTAAASLTSCDVSGACFAATSTVYFQAANFTSGKSLRVGFYPKDICIVGASNTPNGCTGSAVFGTYPMTMTLTFSIRATDGASVTKAGGEAVSNEFAISFHKDAPSSYSCQTASLYVPADENIYFNCASVSATTASAGAPLANVFFAAQKNAAVTTTGSAVRNSSVVETPVWKCPGAKIGGFENAAAPTYATPEYGVSVSVRDEAGLVATLGTASCIPSVNLTTRDIRGFLNSSNCFISSSSLGSASIWTEGFRQLRDRVLMRFGWGRAVAEWYYSWSPAGAAWLTQHPWAQGIVGVVLLPFSVIAWVLGFLGVGGLLALAVAGVLGGGGWWLRRRFS